MILLESIPSTHHELISIIRVLVKYLLIMLSCFFAPLLRLKQGIKRAYTFYTNTVRMKGCAFILMLELHREREKEMTIFNLIYFSTDDLDILS